jgi:hypothetical protein
MADDLRQLTAGLGPSFSTLERRSQAMMELTAKVREALTGAEKEHVISASYRGSTLVVIADSAAWSTHIRYAQQQLLDQVSGPGDTRFTKLRVKVGAPAAAGVSNESEKR